MNNNRLPTQDEVSNKAKEIGQRVFKRVTRRMLEDRDKRITQLEAEVEGLELDLEVSGETVNEWIRRCGDLQAEIDALQKQLEKQTDSEESDWEDDFGAMR